MRSSFVILCFLTFCFPLNAEQQSDRITIEEALRQYKDLDNDPQLLLLERSLQKSEGAFGPIDTTTAKVYKALSAWYDVNADFDKALEFSKKYLDALVKIGLYPQRTAAAFSLTAKQYMELQDFEKAGEYFQQSQKYNEERDPEIDVRNFMGLATVLLSQGNFNLQIEHAKYAYELATSPEDKCAALHVQFQGRARLGQLRECYDLIEEQLLLSKDNDLKYERGRAYASLGWVNNIKARKQKKESTEAYYFFREAINYYDKGVRFMDGSGHQDELRTISWAYKNISNQYKMLGNIDLSVQYAKLAIEENKAFFNKDYYPELADLYHNLATKYSGEKDYEAALRQIQNAIKCLLQDESFTDPRATIPQENLYKVSIKWQLLRELREKALCYAHLYLKHKNKEDVISAERNLSNAVDLIDIMRAQLSTDDTKIYWRNRTKFIYDTAVEMADWLDDNEKVLKYMEKSRSLLLLEELNHKDAKSLIPYKLAEREELLRETIIDAKGSEVEMYKAYNTFLDSLRVAYPSYYKYKFDVKTPTIEEVQRDILDDSTQVLSYHITPDSLYLLNITKRAAKLMTQPRPKTLKSDINTLLGYVNNKDSLEFKDNFDAFIGLSKKLYKTLFSKVYQEGNKVIVVGDGPIEFVPFDILVSGMEADRPTYLIEEYMFSYAPSLSVLQKYHEEKAFNDLLILSPGSFNMDFMVPLVQSEDEIEQLKKISNTHLLDNDRATLQNFVSVCQDYDVIHFSTHSGLDKDSHQPWIAFRDSLISLNEIYKLHLKAALVTLSSCKSYDGLDRTGEGINSLSRAFLFANASSVIGSMWNLNEVAGNRILIDFYTNLKNEKDKPTALREAKIKYINANKYKSPYYWASLVLVGDPSGLNASTQSSHFFLLYILGAVIFIFFLLNLLKREKKISNTSKA